MVWTQFSSFIDYPKGEYEPTEEPEEEQGFLFRAVL